MDSVLKNHTARLKIKHVEMKKPVHERDMDSKLGVAEAAFLSNCTVAV